MKNLILIIFLYLLSNNINAQVSVIANNSVAENSIKADLLAKIYSLDITKWSNNFKIVVVEQSARSNVKTVFYSFIDKDPAALQKEWLKKQITGEAKPPVLVESDEEVLKIVASTPGAVGYIKSSSVSGNVKVIATAK
ncbi:MAG TPA: hypothetical protein VMT35_10225 [Ignavibacteriaceae bacterium]|nr:hypothetical protein [Ignavibacteriaceae bacterium]